MRAADDPGEPGYEADDEYNLTECPLGCGETVKCTPQHIRHKCDVAAKVREGELWSV